MIATVNASNSAAREPRNTLARGAQHHSPGRGGPRHLSPAVHAQLLRSAIGHAAVLSDTPEKWASTIALLKQHGVDPAGYDDFDEGRPLAIADSGVAPQPDVEENDSGR
ncbi:MAG: hypothetical protein WAN43_14200 [Rhodomicrobium sp.]